MTPDSKTTSAQAGSRSVSLRLPVCLDGRWEQVKAGYVIATTMRTGSYLLCEGLYATGLAGNPAEAFCPDHRERYCRRWNLDPGVDFAGYFHAVVENGTTPNGIFGVKIHRHHVAPLARECAGEADPDDVVAALFPAARYIYLRRRDVRGQAISYYRANLTNEWWRIAGEKNPLAREYQPVFDAEAILRVEEELRGQDLAWQNFFAARKIEPLEMEYDSLWHDYRNEIARVLVFLGQDPAAAHKLPEPRLVRQADATTEEWRRKLGEVRPGQG